MKETIQLPVIRYRTPEGEPTCCYDVTKGETCIFHRVMRFGTLDTCCFAEINYSGQELLERRPNNGFLIPLKNCPIWKEEQAR